MILALLTPSTIGYQDLKSLIARQPQVSESWRRHVMASPFGTIHAATFSFPRPIGSNIPPVRYHLANFDPSSLDVTGSLPSEAEEEEPAQQIQFPTVNRALKGDRLRPAAAPRESEPQAVPQPPKQRERSQDTAEAPPQDHPQITPQPGPQDAPQETASAPAADEILSDEEPLDPAASAALASLETENSPASMARIYFGGTLVAPMPGTLEPWRPGEAPVVTAPIDSDMKRNAAEPAPANGKEGETVAKKGEVSSEVKRPKTPAERLGLTGKSRARHERCLANAVYFEARSEPERGQMAVAQVVMNRVFSGRYPDNVCGVVYQNANRHLACQFTFACDGIRDVVTEPEAWAIAKRIARDTLDGKLWLPELGKATHYHAAYVRPYWVREMKKMNKFGIHTFYRPRAWGKGSDEPAWESAAKAWVVSGHAAPKGANDKTAAAKL